MKSITRLEISEEAWIEMCNIGNGTFYPLKGFMDSADYRSVVENMHLHTGAPWTIPITLDVPEHKVDEIIRRDKIILINRNNEEVAELFVEDVYKVNYANDIKKIFLCDEKNHPGVKKEISRTAYRVGGPINILKYEEIFFSKYSFPPEKGTKIFKDKKWKTIAGFQTRNPIHKAHEYLQRIAMEIVDGIFIQPLVGWKKKDDFSSTAIIKAYEKMTDEFYPEKSVVLSVLKTPMRYAGPREAVFHAIIRRNFGCTHFIVGRDHAGVGGYYGKYDAHKLCSQFNDLGIKILALKGPYYCRKCKSIVSEKNCPHGEKYALSISGTEVRTMFKKGIRPPEEYMRKEISNVLIGLQRENKLFCTGLENEF